MDQKALTEEALSRLGKPIVCPELIKDPKAIGKIFDRTYRWFNSHKGMVARDSLMLVGGTSTYTLADNVLEVTNVYPPMAAGLGGITEFFPGFSGLIVGGLGFTGAGSVGPFGNRFGGRDIYPLSAMLQAQQMNEMARHVLSAEFEWEYFRPSLIVSPVPAEGGTAIYDYVKAVANITEVPENSVDHELIAEWVHAEFMEVLGRIYTKFGSLPGADTEINLNGDRLLDDAAAKKDELTVKIRDAQLPVGPMQG